ncbi:putative PEP-binding protein [Thaumasiovibrio sp. DFM-14]|uniref:putative PEP-binding protein n=1 Tax=Thaumasiovibrio sp. DFM-14 TaxID=3384792 RepID=UPI0039A11657
MIKLSETDIDFLSLYPREQAPEDAGLALVSLERLAMKIIGVHPYAIANFSALDVDQQQAIIAHCQGDEGVAEYYVATLAAHIKALYDANPNMACRIELSSEPQDTLSHLLGAPTQTEPNSLLGIRGVVRFRHESYRTGFNLDCEVVKRCQQLLGADKVQVVVPFVRTLSEAASMIDILAEQGLCRGANQLKVWLKADLPANLILASKFLQYVDGLIIDTDNIAQYAQGLDLSNSALTYLYDEQNEAVLELLLMGMKATKHVSKPCLIVNRHLPKSPRMQAWLLEQGVNSAIC